MGRSRRKYKEKGQETFAEGDCNQAILPNKTQMQIKKKFCESVPKKLSKKQRKNLQRVLDTKKKKQKRNELLSLLSTVQVSPSELAMLDSVAHIGTKNAKVSLLSKRPLPADLSDAIKNQSQEDLISINSIKFAKGKGKRRKLAKEKKKESFPKVQPSHSESEDMSSDLESTSDGDHDPVLTKDNAAEEIIQASEADSKIEATVDGSKNTLEGKETNSVEILKTVEVPPVASSSDTSKTVVEATYVQLDRDPKIQEERMALPILAEEQAIMEAISENPVTIVCGETGSGKTTQVPQFLYEAGYARSGMIGITEPRRVAAVSMSKRVATEMNLPQSKVSYHIRYENNVTAQTEVKFMTDGVLSREMKADFLLTKYSVIILDEAHERTTNTDVLIGLLSRVVPVRAKRGKPLKLIIMSATLRIEDFTKNQNLFKSPPPVIKIEVRQFPVTVHFNKRTPIATSNDKRQCPYLSETYKKICKIHRTLPGGGILVFVTGKQEIYSLIRKLNATFPSHPVATCHSKQNPGNQEQSLPKISLDRYKATPDINPGHCDVTEEKDLRPSDNEDESDSEFFLDEGEAFESDSSLPMHVLPLYSLLPPKRQNQVFEQPPEGCRLCVIATNVAETSLTIPGIKYVVDSGKVKRRVYDKVTGISSFRVAWISKASANQRAGRAGRTEPGHAYRLYSSAVFQDFDDHDSPEIASKPVAGMVLQMKSMHIDRVVNFPFPTPPSHEALESAENLLISLGAIEPPPKKLSVKEMRNARFSGKISELGKLVSSFPVHPRFGKMIAMAVQSRQQNDVIAYVIAVVAALTVREIFVAPSAMSDHEHDKEKIRQLSARLHHLKVLWSTVGGGPERKAFGDLMVYLGAVGAAEYSGGSAGYCASNCIRPKALLEIRKLRSQLTNTLNCVIPDSDVCMDPKMKPPTEEQVKLLRRIVLSSLGDQVARLLPKESLTAEQAKQKRGAYQCLLSDEPVFVHPESVLSRDPLPAYVAFHEIVENETTKRAYMRDLIEIDPSWLASLCPQYCTFSEPRDSPEPFYDPEKDDVRCYVTATYGRLAWQLGEVEISFPTGLDRFRWFARSLLEGKVFRQLSRFSSSLLSRPVTMVKSWSNLQPRTETLLLALHKKSIDSRSKLTQAWRENPSFLRATYLEWLPTSIHDQLIASWPPSK